MSKPLQYNFVFTSDGITHDATVSEISDALTPQCANYVWNITPKNVGVIGIPTYTVEVSSDGITWFDYDTLFTDVSTVDAVEDTQLSFTHIRVNHNGGTASAGTVEYLFTQKPRS